MKVAFSFSDAGEATPGSMEAIASARLATARTPSAARGAAG